MKDQKKLVILDVDGVMTDGTKLYGSEGLPIHKRFCDQDFTAIKILKAMGDTVCFLSADNDINRAVAEKRKIDFWYARGKDGIIDKVKVFKSIIQFTDYKVKAENIVYIGDDIFDLPLMKEVYSNGGRIFCPANASPLVLQYIEWKYSASATILKTNGGAGVISELLFKLHLPSAVEDYINAVIKLDGQEVEAEQ